MLRITLSVFFVLMMNQYDKFAVKHTSFEKSIRESFHDMLQDQNHTDVTLAADDGNPINAHQIVLSAGSKFFSDVFKRSRHTSPYIYLRGFNRIDLQNIVEFLYMGEASLPQRDIDSFLGAAKQLEIKGLEKADNDDLPDFAIRKEDLSSDADFLFTESDPQLETRLDVGEGPIQMLAEACEEEQYFTEPETISSDIEYDHAVNQMKTDEQTVLKWRLLTKAIWTKSTIGYSNKS